MSIIFLGTPNVATRRSLQILAGGAEPVSGEATKLKNNEPQETARISTVNPLQTYWLMRTFGDVFDFGGLAFANNNLTDTGYYRVVADDQAYANYVTISPSALADSTNLSSSNVTLIQGTIGIPNGTYLGPANPALSWSFRAQFDQNPITARQGTAMAHVVVETKRVSLGTDFIYVYPTIKVRLWENGVLIRDLGYKPVDRTDQIFIFPFDPAELASPSVLANVEVEVIGYTGDSGLSEYFKVDTLSINYDDGTITPAYDTGWLSADQGVFGSIREGALPTKSVHALAPSTIPSVNTVKLLLLDDGVETDAPLDTVFYPNSVLTTALSFVSAGYVEGGLVILGPKLEVTPGIVAGSAQPATSVITVSLGGTSQRGQSYGADSYSMRGVPNALEIHCSRDVMMQLMTRIGWQKGSQGVFYVIMDPDLAMEYQLFSAFPCTCKSITSTPVLGGRTGQTRGEDMFVVRMELEEKL